MLFIGVSDYGFGCHRSDFTHGADPQPCPDGGGPGNPAPDDGLYIVTITTPTGVLGEIVAGETRTPWHGWINETQVDINHGDLPQWTDLSYFLANVDGGGTCFFTEVEFRGNLRVGKGGTARGKFGFDGRQDDGTDARYTTRMFGTFDDFDPSCGPFGQCFVFPLEVDEFARMEMVDWELWVQGGKNIQNVSCMGESPPKFNPPVVILVERIS